MFKFIRGKTSQSAAERLKVQKELFAYQKTITHGFPTKPCGIAYSQRLGLLAIATKSGILKVVGKPGVEYSGKLQKEDSTILKIIFVSKFGRLVTLSDDNSLHLWQIKNLNASLQIIKTYSLEGKLKKISSVVLKGDESQLYIGTEGGNVYTLDLANFEMTDKIIYLDVVLQNGPENYKVNPGAVECILEHLSDSNKLLIGYERGLIVIWDIKEQKTLTSFVSSQQLEDLSWVKFSKSPKESSYFVTSHNDGSYVIWDVNKPEKPYKEAVTPYGPYPCKRLPKMRLFQEEGTKPEEFLMVFTGGMPRAAYGEHFTLTVAKDGPKSNGNSDEDSNNTSHVVFDLTSKIIDFIVIENVENEESRPTAVVILAEEEIVVVDLKDDKWPVFYPHPYLNSLHPSVVTCSHYAENVTPEVLESLKKIGNDSWDDANKYSKNTWPIIGGEVTGVNKETQLLITGHEDGSVRFWDTSGPAMSLLCKFNSSILFNSDEMITADSKDEDDDEWPPFRKVGVFDPYSDDPRLAVKKLNFCPKTGVLTIGGTAGQVIIVNTTKHPDEGFKLEVDSCNLVADKDGFVWKGHEALSYRPKNNPNLNSQNSESSTHSCNVIAILQIQPPAAITALALEAISGVVAIGTAHGVLLYDITRKKVVMTKSTLNPNDVMAAGDTPISRRKSIKKSLRESFRRLRKGRSQRSPTGPAASVANKSPTGANSIQNIQNEVTKPLERAIEARTNDDAMSSMVRCVTFSKTYILSLNSTTPTLWVGTNAGTVLVFTVNVPGGEKRMKENVGCSIAKEIQLKHRAPVLSVIVIDCNSSPVDGFSLKHDHLGPHKVLIGSEEQMKLFTLPSLRPFGKLKLTAQEGSRVRKIGIATFTSSVDSSYSEKCLTCLTNQGDLCVISIPDLRRQISTICIRREDISGISSFVFNEKGEAFYMRSSSELQRLSLSAKTFVKPLCSVQILSLIDEISALAFNEREIGGGSNMTSTPITENAQNEIRLVDEMIQEIADITIDSVRDHVGNTSTNSNNAANSAANSSSVDERLIDGGSLTSTSAIGAVTNQIKSVTTVTTTTVVNSIQGGNVETISQVSTIPPTVSTTAASPEASGRNSETATVLQEASL